MIYLALVAVPLNFKIDVYLSPGESMGYFKDFGMIPDIKEIAKINTSVSLSPIFIGSTERTSQIVCFKAYARILTDLGLCLNSGGDDIITEEPIRYQESYSMHVFIFVNIFQYLKERGWAEKVLKAVVDSEDYAREIEEAVSKYMNK
jgi:hypothetical protein